MIEQKLIQATVSTILVLGLASVGHSQGLCFETAIPHPIGSLSPDSFAVADFDNDGVLDVAVTQPALAQMSIYKRIPDAVWSAPTIIPAIHAGRPTAADLDGDGDMDIACLTQNGTFAVGSGAPTVLFNAGNGTFTQQVIYPISGSAPQLGALTLGDFDGDLDVDMIALFLDGVSNTGVRLTNNGAGAFTADSIALPPFNSGSFRVGQLNGGGVDSIVAELSGLRSVRICSNGVGSGSVLPGSANVQDCTLGDFDGDGDVDIAAVMSGSGIPSELGVWHNDGAGAFTLAATQGLGAPSYSLRAGDFDGDGRSEMLVSQGGPVSPVLVFDELSPGVLGQTGVLTPGSPTTFTLSCIDIDRDGDLDTIDLISSAGRIDIIRNCRLAGRILCVGDGSGALCPCGNTSAPSSGQGCANSLALGGAIRGSGAAGLTTDSLVLETSNVPSGSFVMFLQADAVVAGGAGSTFGDGLLCAGGNIIRLALKGAPGGVASFPGVGDPSIHTAGAVVSSAERIYQGWFRDAAAFCTSSTFNLTNAIQVVWQ